MNVAVGLMDGLGLDGDRCIRMIPRQSGRYASYWNAILFRNVADSFFFLGLGKTRIIVSD